MFGNIIRYKDILWYRTLAHLKAESKNNYLGYLWFILEPVISTAILYFVFGVVFGNRSNEFVLHILIGMMCWQWFEGSITMGMSGIREKLGILNTMSIPKYIFPLVNILANTWKFICVFFILIILVNILGYHISVAYICLPLVLFIQLLVLVGLAIPLSIIVAYMPDMTNLISSVFRLMFFFSGIFFTVDKVPEQVLFYFNLNPAALLMNAFRTVLIQGKFPDIGQLLYCTAFGAVTLVIGLALSSKVDKKIIKAVSA